MSQLCSFPQEKVSELQKEVHWHQERTSSKGNNEKLPGKEMASKRLGPDKRRLNTRQNPLYSSKDEVPSIRGEVHDENICWNTGSGKQSLSLSTAEAIQMAVDCQNGRWACLLRDCFFVVGNSLMNACH